MLRCTWGLVTLAAAWDDAVADHSAGVSGNEKMLSVPVVLLRRQVANDAARLVLRHENAVLRRQLAGPASLRMTRSAVPVYCGEECWILIARREAAVLRSEVPTRNLTGRIVSCWLLTPAPGSATPRSSDRLAAHAARLVPAPGDEEVDPATFPERPLIPQEVCRPGHRTWHRKPH